MNVERLTMGMLMISSQMTTRRSFTRPLKGKKCENSGIAPLKKDGIAHSDPRIKTTILNNQFSSVFSEETSTNLPSMGKSLFPDVHTFTVDKEGVRKLLHGLNPHKAEGPHPH